MRVLFISNKDFRYQTDTGGKQCSKRNYDLVSKIFGCENIYLLILTNTNIDAGLKEREKIINVSNRNIVKYKNMFFLRDCYSKKDEIEILKYIKNINPDISFFDGTSFGYIADFLSQKCKIIAFYHNIEKRYAQSRIFRLNPICVIKFFSFWFNERYITKKADIRICLNERDSRLLFENYHYHSDFYLPITFNDTIKDSDIKNEKIDENYLLFVGSYFMPNIQGIIWFCKEVMPHVNKKLVIVGKSMEKLKKKLECSNVEVIGTVDDLKNYYMKAAAIVMPILTGDGMKVKTAEAMMYGKMLFATNEALEGYSVENIKGIYRCNSADEFIEAINKEKKYEFSFEVRELFKKRYSNAAIEKDFIKFVTNFKWRSINED